MINNPNVADPSQGDPTGNPQAHGATSTSHGDQSTPEVLAAQLAETKAKLAALEDEAFKNREKARIKKQQDEAAEAERQKQLKAQGEHEALAKTLQATVDELKAQIAERDQEIARRDFDALRTAIALKHGLAPALASRLSGQTEAELEADAKELKKFVQAQAQPKPAAGNGPNPRPISPGQQQIADVEELRRRARESGKYAF